MNTEKEYLVYELYAEKEKFMGKSIEFTSVSEYDEVLFNKGMRAVVKGFKEFHAWDESESHVAIALDFGEFEEYNKDKMQANFYDNDRIPCKKWIETNLYNKGLATIYTVMYKESLHDRDFKSTFKLV